jgi:putative FmdB family regulatory protein
MAYYEFECQKCHQTFTVKQTFAEHDRGARPKCPKCRSQKVARLVTAVHLQTSKKS